MSDTDTRCRCHRRGHPAPLGGIDLVSLAILFVSVVLIITGLIGVAQGTTSPIILTPAILAIALSIVGLRK